MASDAKVEREHSPSDDDNNADRTMAAGGRVVAAYYASWSCYRDPVPYTPTDVPRDTLTHLIYVRSRSGENGGGQRCRCCRTPPN